MEKLINQLLEKTTVHDINNLLETINEEKNVAWIPVGGRENNLATINLGSDPAAGLVERITMQ